MLAVSDLWTLAGGTVLAAIAIAVGTSVVHLVIRQRADAAEDLRDMGTITAFLFDTPQDTRTRIPAKKGWTTKVDEALVRHDAKLEEIARKLDLVVAEVTPDGNGGHNLRGEVTKARTEAARAASAAEVEATAQAEERDRVRRKP